MPAVRKKLNSQAGVAMVVALVFFLLCVMVGMVIVTAATVSAGSVALERETWRETEALTSAAQLLADDVKGMTFTGGYKKTKTVTTTVTDTGKTDADGNTVYKTTVTETGPTYGKVDAAPTLTGSTILNGKLDLSALYYSKQGVSTDTPSPVDVNLTFAVGTGGSGDTSGDAEESTVPEVKGTLTVGTDYTMTAVLKCGSSALTMVFEPKVSNLTGTAAQSTRSTDSATTITKITTTPYSTTVKWGDPVITKGATS